MCNGLLFALHNCNFMLYCNVTVITFALHLNNIYAMYKFKSDFFSLCNDYFYIFFFLPKSLNTGSNTDLYADFETDGPHFHPKAHGQILIKFPFKRKLCQ